MELDYLVAPPRMALYIEYSTRIYQVYLKYLAPEDIYPYSIDEVFMDVTDYLDTYNLTARQLAQKMILDVLETTGITAAAGMGENLYLAKIAMDIVAKHIQPDEKGVRIAKLSETTYRRLLWDHRPLTDFWRIGPGYAKKLEANGLYTMGDIARCSIGKETDYYNEELLYKLFGINANVSQLVCLSNLENLNAVFINEEIPQAERLAKLNAIAISQMKVLTEDHRILQLEDKEDTELPRTTDEN